MRIREARMSAGLSQERLGQLAGLGQSDISRIENGRQAVTIDAIRRIAQALSVPAADLLGVNDNRPA